MNQKAHDLAVAYATAIFSRDLETGKIQDNIDPYVPQEAAMMDYLSDLYEDAYKHYSERFYIPDESEDFEE